MSLSDQELVEQIRGGSHRAFRKLYLRHGPVLISFAKRFVGDKALAEDIVQSLFLKLIEEPQREVRKFRSWAHACVRNQALNMLRQRSREVSLLVENEGPPIREVLLPQLERVEAKLLQLKFIGASTEEIAGELGVATGTVKSRWARLRQRLKKEMS